MFALRFGINLGWVFLITWLPTYLKEVKQVDPWIEEIATPAANAYWPS